MNTSILACVAQHVARTRFHLLQQSLVLYQINSNNNNSKSKNKSNNNDNKNNVL